VSALAVELHPPAYNISCSDESLIVELVDGEGIYWPETDEDLSVHGLLLGMHLLYR